MRVRPDSDAIAYRDPLDQRRGGIVAPKLADKSHRAANPLTEEVLRICADPRYGKGRQNFLLALAQKRVFGFADRIVPLLEDPDVAAHAIIYLRRARDVSAVDRITAFAADPAATLRRREARRYLRAHAERERNSE